MKKDERMTEQPEAKIDETKTKEEASLVEEDHDDSWAFYDLDIVEEWQGLKVEILAMGLGEQIESIFQDEPKDVVALKFRLENTRENGVFTVYPDQATLITSTGEQLEPDIWESDHIGGKIYEGVIKDGFVIWILQRGNVFNIDWIRVKFNAYDEEAEFASKNWRKDFDIRIDIP
ncbi:hypothetical protein [Thermosyntropha lipolytica]|uniref:hypothetical protein n=1 Tax=Thermosyntropha lipolytica TaxID=54294 RepID=UPI0011607E6B|nr:hypothetical protein [Thermosyntropha lipolytica]